MKHLPIKLKCYFPVIFIPIFSCACATLFPKTAAVQGQTEQLEPSPPQIPEWIWDTRPGTNSLIFIASGPRLSDREREKYSALKDAALQAGVFSGFWGARQDFVASSLHGTTLLERTRAYYDGPAADSALKNLNAENVWITDEGTWVKFRLAKANFPALNWQPEYQNGNPTWIHRPPSIPGWFTAVGLGGKQSTLALTFRKADAAALAALIQQVHGKNRTVNVEKTQTSQNWTQSSLASVSYGKGFGQIKGFLVVARWQNKSGVWSLAVCPREWN